MSAARRTNGQGHPHGRVRITRVQVTLEAWVDRGGDDLAPLAIQPVTYAVADWPSFNLDAVRAAVQVEVDKGAAASPATDTAAT